MRLVQIKQGEQRRLALLEEPHLRMLSGADSLYALASAAILHGGDFSALVDQSLTTETLPYDAVYAGASPWHLLPPVDHPLEPACCHVSGTGLTHLGSARDRNAMHDLSENELTDSMRIFQWGIAGGKPEGDAIGVAPEWFYKGNGSTLRAHGEALEIPFYAEDGGEEAEIAACYIIAPNGEPYRLGMAIGNEFSDHVFERKNLPQPRRLKAAHMFTRSGACHQSGIRIRPRQRDNYAGRNSGLVEGNSDLRSRDVPRSRQFRAPSLQIRAQPPPRGRARALSGSGSAELW